MKAIVFCLKRNNIHIKYHFILTVSSEVAKNCFGKIKRRYLAKRLELRKVDKSGTFSSVVEKARKDLNAYSFLFWIDEYLKPLRTKSNVKDINLEMSGIRKRTVKPPKIRLYFKNLMTSLSMKSKFLMLHRSENRHSRVKNQRVKNSTLEEKHLSILNRIDKELKEQSETIETQDEEYFYDQTVAASKRKLGDMEKCMIKHEINNIPFKYQMSLYKAQNTASTSQRIAYPTPPTPTRFFAVTSSDFNWQHTHASNFSQASPHGCGSYMQSTKYAK